MNSQQPAKAPEIHGESASPLPQFGSNDAETQLTDYQRNTAHSRHSKYIRAAALMDSGFSSAAAAAEVGWANVTLWRIEKRIREQGLPGLVPRKSTGAPPLLDPALYTPAVVSELQRLAVKLGGAIAAARVFAVSPECPRPLADYILSRDSIPERLRKLIGYRRVSRPIRVAGSFVHVEGAGTDQQAA